MTGHDLAERQGAVPPLSSPCPPPSPIESRLPPTSRSRFDGEAGAQCPCPIGQEHCTYAPTEPAVCFRVATLLLRERSRGELPPTPTASTSLPGPLPVRW